MKHKHITEQEVLTYIKKGGKIKSIDKKIRECAKCYDVFNRVYYREKFLKEAGHDE